MSPTTIKFTREELIERRRSLLDRLDVTLAEFRNRVTHGSLTGNEWYAAEDLNEIDFLLGDDEE